MTAVAACNVHDDAELAQQMVRLCLDLPFKSAALKHKLNDDIKKLNELIEEERKDEVRLYVGPEPFEITKSGARHGRSFIATQHVDSLRWGTVVNRTGHTIVYDFSMVLAGRR